eukprot:m.306484 g.306484  ORF g.306484 m.306484 type:complete len:805 (-) comp18977_c0_seq1:85-2499(-)
MALAALAGLWRARPVSARAASETAASAQAKMQALRWTSSSAAVRVRIARALRDSTSPRIRAKQTRLRLAVPVPAPPGHLEQAIERTIPQLAGGQYAVRLRQHSIDNMQLRPAELAVAEPFSAASATPAEIAAQLTRMAEAAQDNPKLRIHALLEPRFGANGSALHQPQQPEGGRPPRAAPPPPPLAMPWLEKLPANWKASPNLDVVSFYRFVDVADPEALASLLRRIWRPLAATGRIYVAREGINAQMAFPASARPQFEEATHSVPELAGIFFNYDEPVDRQLDDNGVPTHPGPFRRLAVKARPQIVADGGDLAVETWSERNGTPVSPAEWHQRLIEQRNAAAARPLLLDCRNDFESDLGKFEHAIPLDTVNFRDSWGILREMLSGHDRDEPIMTYCTGGIRCVKVGAFLEQDLGFRNVFRLEGGVVSYLRHLREEGKLEESTFRGQHFVFDARLATTATDEKLAPCRHCGARTNLFFNCRYEACHTRVIQCPACHATLSGCCSAACAEEAAIFGEDNTKAVKQFLDELFATGKLPRLALSETDRAEVMKLLPLPETHVAPGLLDTSPKRSLVTPLRVNSLQNVELNRVVDRSLDAFLAPEIARDAELESLARRTKELFPRSAHMLSGTRQARLLATMVRELGAHRVLELGTFTGYSALAMARALPPEIGHLVTCDIDDEVLRIARQALADAGTHIATRVDIRELPASELLESLSEPFDFIFVDANKAPIRDYYDTILNRGLLSPRGLIAIDNAMFLKTPDRTSPRHDRIRRNMHELFEAIRRDNRVQWALLTIRDGILLLSHS